MLRRLSSAPRWRAIVASGRRPHIESKLSFSPWAQANEPAAADVPAARFDFFGGLNSVDADITDSDETSAHPNLGGRMRPFRS
jgi:hypothetical protein